MPYLFVPPAKREATQTNVYVMACRDAVKIGIATDVERRRRSLQTSCPDEVTVLSTVLLASFAEARATEKRMHAAFAQYRTFGEWFRMPQAPVLDMLATVEPCIYPAPAPLPVKPREYPDDDPQMARMRIAARSLEF